MLCESWKKNQKFENSFEVKVKAPANIALVKYWGKKGHQLPANPSLSLTLKNSITETTLTIKPSQKLVVDFYFERERNDLFGKKTKAFLESLVGDLPVLNAAEICIESRNTFPHSSGIASSASSQAALAYGLGLWFSELSQEKLNLQSVSYLARLGSGSACRSVFGGFVSWGETPLINGSSDSYATDITSKIHPDFKNLQDAILIVSSREKVISSRQGHSHMKEHPYFAARVDQANQNFEAIYKGLINGDFKVVGEKMEEEALSLHALMMTSNPGYILLEANSLEIIKLIRLFREQSSVPVYFTIDAGPNIHLIYPESEQRKVEAFVRHELLRLTENGNSVIWDSIGAGVQ
jgi:diphosphomevalonate decarboxylase